MEKPDSRIRLCLDPKDLNKAVLRERYQIPKAEEILNRLSCKVLFSVLDMKDGFWQLELNDKSSYLTTFNTPFGRFRFRRLPYGICSAPEIFQKHCKELFADIVGCEIYFDDLIISGINEADYNKVLSLASKRAKNNNIKFNSNKFQFKE